MFSFWKCLELSATVKVPESQYLVFYFQQCHSEYYKYVSTASLWCYLKTGTEYSQEKWLVVNDKTNSVMISLNFTSEHLPATNEKISYISLQTFFLRKTSSCTSMT